MILKLQQHYNVNGRKLQLVLVYFKRTVNRERFTEYIFRSNKGKTISIKNKNLIKEL